MGSWCVQLLSLSLVLCSLTWEGEAQNHRIDCSNNNATLTVECGDAVIGLGFVVAVLVSLCLGVVLGVACTVAAYKFMKWMEGKSLIFSPLPRIQLSRDVEDSAMQNPTYELRAASSKETSAAKRYPKSTQQAQNSHTQEVYEAVDEPVNQAEVLEPMEQFGLLPYAIHDFTEDSTSLDIKSSSVVSKAGPTVPSKVNINRPKKGNKDLDIRRSMSESGSDKKPLKPPKAQKIGILKKPALRSVPRTQSTSASAAPPPQGMYSELDKKTSYATLEPHIGREEVPMAEHNNSKESYCHLNH